MRRLRNKCRCPLIGVRWRLWTLRAPPAALPSHQARRILCASFSASRPRRPPRSDRGSARRRWRSGLDPLCCGRMSVKPPPWSDEAGCAAAFWERVDKSGGPDACWPWTGPRFPTGYGMSSLRVVGAKVSTASRAALILTAGPAPRLTFGRSAYTLTVGRLTYGRPAFALHSCDNPPCCNPSHLRWGTARENAADMFERGRARPRGVPSSKSRKSGPRPNRRDA